VLDLFLTFRGSRKAEVDPKNDNQKWRCFEKLFMPVGAERRTRFEPFGRHGCS
jgi:hypothetical protein